MNLRAQGAAMGMCGFFAGGFVASIVQMRPLPKAALVGATAAMISALVWTVLRSKSAQYRAPGAQQSVDHNGTPEV
jgi:hypothetical protein